MATALGTVLLGLVAGCGGAPPPPPKPPPAPAPVYRTLDEMRNAAAGRQQADQTAQVLINGVINGQPDPTFAGVGGMRSDGVNPAIAFSEQARRPGGALVDVSLVVLGGDAYLKPPPDVALPPRKSWQRIDPATADPFDRQFVPVVAALRRYLDVNSLFSGYGAALRLTGSAPDRIGRLRTQRYELTVDPATAPAGLPAATVQLWLDAQDHLVRVHAEQPAPRLTLDAVYQDWGKPVTIVVPDPTQIAQ